MSSSKRNKVEQMLKSQSTELKNSNQLDEIGGITMENENIINNFDLDELDMSGINLEPLPEEVDVLEETNMFEGKEVKMTSAEGTGETAEEAAKKAARTRARDHKKKKEAQLIKEATVLVDTTPKLNQLRAYMSQKARLVGFVVRDDARIDMNLASKTISQRVESKKAQYTDAFTMATGDSDAIPAANRVKTFDLTMKMKNPSTILGAVFLVPEVVEELVASQTEPELSEAEIDELINEVNPKMKVKVTGNKNDSYIEYVQTHFHKDGVLEAEETFMSTSGANKSMTISPSRYIMAIRTSKKFDKETKITTETQVLYLKHEGGRRSLIHANNIIPINTFEEVNLTLNNVKSITTDVDGKQTEVGEAFFKFYLEKRATDTHKEANKLQIPSLDNLVDKNSPFLKNVNGQVVSPLLQAKSAQEFDKEFTKVDVSHWSMQDETGKHLPVPNISLPLKSVVSKVTKVTQEDKSVVDVSTNMYRFVKNHIAETPETIVPIMENGIKVGEDKIVNSNFFKDNPRYAAFNAATNGLLEYEDITAVENINKTSKVDTTRSQETTWKLGLLQVQNKMKEEEQSDALAAINS